MLDLEPHAPADDYLARRRDLGADEVNRRLVRAAGIDTFVVDTGLVPERLTSPGELAALAGPAATRSSGSRRSRRRRWPRAPRHVDVPDEVVVRLRSAGAVGAKSIAAYRVGLSLPAAPPDRRPAGGRARRQPTRGGWRTRW